MPQAQPFPSAFAAALTNTIGAGTSVAANSTNLNNNTLVGLIIPAGWTPAALGFSVAPDSGSVFNPLYDNTGTEISIPVPASLPAQIALDPAQFAGVGTLVLRSGAVGSPVNQTSGVTITLITRPVA